MSTKVSPKFGKLAVRKTRDKEAKEKSLPAVIDSSSEPPKPEDDVDKYTDDRLKQDLKFADVLMTRRDTTSRIINYMILYKKTIQRALEAFNPRERDVLLDEVINMKYVINDRKFIYLKPSDKVKEMQADLLASRKIEYYARYEDYLKRIPNQIRSHVIGMNHPDQTSLSSRKSWTSIGQQLWLESKEADEMLDKGASNADKIKSPVHRVLLGACQRLGIDFDRAKWSIMEYGTRNENMHRDMEVFIANEDFLSLKTMLYHDYTDVDSVFFGIGRGEPDKQHLKSIIREHIDRYFKTNDDLDDYSSWRATDELVAASRKAGERLNTPTRAEQKAARTSEHEERRKANALNQKLGIPKTRTTSE
jgi:hypothetical protein